VVFLCLGHGKSKSFLEQNQFASHTKIIDLGNDFRLTKDAIFEGKEFIYGLPELNKLSIKNAQFIANPGCFATAIQLALLPLATNDLLNSDVHINATTGSTGAGVSPSETTHFSWRTSNMSHYKAFDHQHLGEINQSIHQLQVDYKNELIFVPNRGDFARGIFATLYTTINESLEELQTKITWPTWANLQATTGVVLLASLFLAVIIFLMDASSNQILKLIYGVK
jgi:N-acetyl-gamma-glutamyl-phosphate reductase